MDIVTKETGYMEMIYTMGEGQLLRVWAAITCFAQIREIQDPMIQSDILTNAQILLTAFVLELQPLPGEQTSRLPRGNQARSDGDV
jgi:hypothetical protein